MKIDINALKIACQTKTKHFGKIIPYDTKGQFWFQDNKADILAVAHLDSVQQCTHFHEMKLPHLHKVYCPVLDDRLGVYIIMHLLKKLGLKYDILLTKDEEMGKSTAQNFTTEKQYNWMFEFDRKDDDVVMYDYETKEMEEHLKKIGWKLGRGSYSDISELQFLECKAFNFGTGYFDYHSLNAYVDINILMKNIQKFFLFYNMFKDVHLPHKEVEKKVWSYRSHNWRDRWDNNDYNYGYASYYSGYDDKEYKCHVCGGSGWIGGKKCANCNGSGYIIESKTTVTSEKKTESTIKSTTLPTLSDLYSYSCAHCGTYIELDIETSSDEAILAAEENICVKCSHTISYFT